MTISAPQHPPLVPSLTFRLPILGSAQAMDAPGPAQRYTACKTMHGDITTHRLSS
ncbi:uncharacterized protein BDV14DRAFT_178511 [Aspergillus stella-maris]|uniref:uncharacterized protein n=1 Tax=Aspergillus stella-maris TaxID=1810926 RepID=UPI003CCDAC93